MTYNRQRKERLRLQARRELPELMRRTGGLCFWCKRTLVMLRSIEEHEIVKRLPKSIYWRDVDGTLLYALIATVDHLEGVFDKNSNQPEKIVVSCSGCNGTRDSGPQSARNKRHVDEQRKEMEVYKPLIRWLRRQGGVIEFGRMIRCYVKAEVEPGQREIVADFSSTDPVQAISGAQRQYNAWYMNKNGIQGRPQVTPGPSPGVYDGQNLSGRDHSDPAGSGGSHPS